MDVGMVRRGCNCALEWVVSRQSRQGGTIDLGTDLHLGILHLLEFALSTSLDEGSSTGSKCGAASSSACSNPEGLGVIPAGVISLEGLLGTLTDDNDHELESCTMNNMFTHQ